jgi:hypothetical protein
VRATVATVAAVAAMVEVIATRGSRNLLECSRLQID